MQGLHTTVQKNLLGSDEFEDLGASAPLGRAMPCEYTTLVRCQVRIACT